MEQNLDNVENNWVFQNNKLIEASYSLTVTEQKILRLLASFIKPDDKAFKEYDMQTKELIKILNTSKGRFYRDIDDITTKLMSRVFKVRNLETGEWVKYHFVDVAKYKDGLLTLKIHPDMKEFYLELDQYTKYRLSNIMQFKKMYSFRIYELLKQYQNNIGKRTFTVEQLRMLMEIEPNKYPKYGNFKQKVINTSVEEINEKSDIYCEIKENKCGKSVESITFFIKNNEKNIKNDENFNKNVKKFQKNTKNSSKQLNFNNYKQREYDYDKLEKQLLGWE